MSPVMFSAIVGFVASFIAVPFILGLIRFFGVYTVVNEGTAHVYVLFGTVIGVLKDPGFHFLPARLGLAAFIVNLLGKRYVVDMRMDQRYLRSQAVNSEEGAPMGVGIWYEMYVSDPVDFIFKNADPQGSLAANVSNAAVRCLSNMPLAQMLENRHPMSLSVRQEVGPKSTEWGYKIGSVYIRKVHLRDTGMIRQIEAKVVNRLRQVTSAIKQDGANQVSVITSSAERQAAVEFAKAQAMRPTIVGAALTAISRDPEVAQALFEILQIQSLTESGGALTLLPPDSGLLGQLVAASAAQPAKA